MMHGLARQTEEDLATKLSRFLFSYRITPNDSTGASPAELMFKRQLRTRLDLLNPSTQDRVIAKQTKMKERYDVSNRPRVVEPNESVYTRMEHETNWCPSVVRKSVGQIVELKLEGGRIVRRHLDQVRSRTDTSLLGLFWALVTTSTMTKVTNFSGPADSTTRSRGVNQISESEKRWRSAIIKGDVAEITRLLAESPELVDWKTALHYAAKVNDISLLRLLAGNYHADVESKNHGLTPLHVAAQAASGEFVAQIMSQFNANPAARDYSGRLPVSYLPETPDGEKLKSNLQGQLGRLLSANPLLHFLTEKVVDVNAKLSTVGSDGIHLTSSNRQLIKAQKEVMGQVKAEPSIHFLTEKVVDVNAKLSTVGSDGIHLTSSNRQLIKAQKEVMGQVKAEPSSMFCGMASCAGMGGGGGGRRRAKAPIKYATHTLPTTTGSLTSGSLKRMEKQHSHHDSASAVRHAYSARTPKQSFDADLDIAASADQSIASGEQIGRDRLDNDLTNQIYSSVRLKRAHMSDRYNPMASRTSSVEGGMNTSDQQSSDSFARRGNQESPNAGWATEMYASIRRNREQLSHGLMPTSPNAESPNPEQPLAPRSAVRNRVAVLPVFPPGVRLRSPTSQTPSPGGTPDASDGQP
nr:unnamed protein product [Spirometra erinaceieuropaei]